MKRAKRLFALAASTSPRSAQSVSVLAAILVLLTLALAVAADAQSWTQQSPTGTPPTARNSAGSAYDSANDRLIVFGGDDDGATCSPNCFPQANLPYPTDVRVLSGATGASPAWSQLAPTGGPPPGRLLHTSVYAPGSNEIVVYGGCLANCGLAGSDVWTLTNANGLGGAPVWAQLAASGSDNREGQAAVYDNANNRMIVFGGQNGFNTYIFDPQVRVLTNADGTGVGTPTWTTISPSGTAPSDREQAAAAYDAANNRLIVFGGATLTCCASVTANYNDVWVLTNANGLGGSPSWTQLAPQGTPPAARFAHSATYDPTTNTLTVFGGGSCLGSCSTVTNYNDVWILTHANGMGGAPKWYQLSPSGSLPDPRGGASAGYNPSTNAMVIALGRSDDPVHRLFNDVWVLRTANGGADLSITKSDSPDPVASGAPLTYTITATNDGPQDATGVTVIDPLPSNVIFKSVSSTQGPCARSTGKKNDPKNGTVTCTVGSLVSGASATITIVVTPTKAGTISNTATVTGTPSDPDTSNNAATGTTTVTGT
jgi:uncharacterized repeat protein (TIGR01451 family)